MKRKGKTVGFTHAGISCWQDGTNVHLKSERDEVANASLHERINVTFPEHKKRLSRQVESLIAAIVKCDPIILLTHCRIRFIGGMGVLKESGAWKEHEECKSRALEYIQSIIVTHKCDWDADEELWDMRQRCDSVIEETEKLYMEMMNFVMNVKKNIQ